MSSNGVGKRRGVARPGSTGGGAFGSSAKASAPPASSAAMVSSTAAQGSASAVLARKATKPVNHCISAKPMNSCNAPKAKWKAAAKVPSYCGDSPESA